MRRDGGVQLVLLLDTDRVQHGACHPVQHDHDRVRDLDERQVRQNQVRADRLWSGERDILRHHLAQHDVQHRDQQQRNGKANRVNETLRQPQGRQRGLDEVGDRRLTDHAQKDGGDGDTELRARQHDGQMLDGVADLLGPLVTRGDHRVQAVLTGGDQRELHRHEEGVDQDQKSGKKNAPQITH